MILPQIEQKNKILEFKKTLCIFLFILLPFLTTSVSVLRLSPEISVKQVAAPAGGRPRCPDTWEQRSSPGAPHECLQLAGRDTESGALPSSPLHCELKNKTKQNKMTAARTTTAVQGE